MNPDRHSHKRLAKTLFNQDQTLCDCLNCLGGMVKQRPAPLPETTAMTSKLEQLKPFTRGMGANLRTLSQIEQLASV
ncbi:hypothetical protein CER19_03685 [Pseudomonas sp. GL93]|nr:hypothetical protein CER19_03685 [Pseudomonas sp. GL93]